MTVRTSERSAASRHSLGDGATAWVLSEGAAGGGRALLVEPRPRAAEPDVPWADLLLERRPLAHEVRIGHLVTAVRLALDLTLRPETAQLDRLAHELNAAVRPCTLRRGEATLVTAQGEEVLRAPLSVDGRVALAGTLEGEVVDDLVGAFHGEGRLALRVRATVTAERTARRLRVEGAWLDVWEALGGTAGETVDLATFESAIDELVRGGRIRCKVEPAGEQDGLAAAAARVVWGRRVILGSPVDERTLQLERHPHPGDSFSTTESVVMGREEELEGEIALHELVARSGEPGPSLVRLVVVDSLSGELTPVEPPRAPIRSRARVLRPIALGGGGRGSFTGGLASANVLTAGSVIASPIHRPVAPTLTGVRPLTDIVLAPPRPLAGPLVSNPGDDDWADTRDRHLRWYAPVPRLETTAEDAPLFTLHREGLTSTGEQALRARLRIPFTWVDPSPTRGKRKPVATSDLGVELELPFRDADDGNRPSTHRLRGEIEETDGTLHATFDALNGWARIAYRALSDEDAEPPWLIVTYRFSGYQEERLSERPNKVFGATLLRPGVTGGLALDPARLTIAHPAGRFHLDPAKLKGLRGSLLLGAKFQANTARREKLVSRTFTRTERREVKSPCSSRPRDYVEVREEGTATIGCRPAFELGAIAYRQFQEITALATDRYRVYQSLIDAGRYLVVPRTYRVGRRPDDASDGALRPLAVLHAALGTDPEDVEVLFEVGLQPDLRPLDRLQLDAALRALDPAATMLWPTEVHGLETEFTWTAADTLADELTSTALPDGTIHFSIGLDVPGWSVMRALLSKTALAGAVTFDFPDGTRTTSTLDINLRRIVGPWETGPVRIERTADGVRLHNVASAPVSVALVASYGSDGLVDSAPVDELIPPDGSISVPWSDIASGAQLATDHELLLGDPVTVEEVRGFVEEVEVTAVLVNELEVDHAVTVEAQIVSRPHTRSVEVAPGAAAAEVSFLLPLTVTLASPSLRYRIVHDGRRGTWRTHSLGASAFVALRTEDLP